MMERARLLELARWLSLRAEDPDYLPADDRVKLSDSSQAIRDSLADDETPALLMNNNLTIQLTSAIAHLLEYIDTSQPEDMFAAMSLIDSAGLQAWARENAVLLPHRRDDMPQADRFKRRD